MSTTEPCRNAALIHTGEWVRTPDDFGWHEVTHVGHVATFAPPMTALAFADHEPEMFADSTKLPWHPHAGEVA